MEVLDDHVKFRRNMHDFYVDYFRNVDSITVLTEPNDNYFSNHWLSAIIIDSKKNGGKTRENLRLAFEVENIESRPLWKPMHLQPVFNEYPYYGSKVAEELFENGLCLPSGSNLTNEDQDRIKNVLDVFFKANS